MITIVDYGAGNIGSVRRACHAVGETFLVTSDPDDVSAAERLIFPGVGASGSALATMRESGLDEALREAFAAGKPLLGICIGCQVALDWVEESDEAGLGLLPGQCRQLQTGDPRLKVPHIGWNDVRILHPHPVLEGVNDGDEFYFVHGYYPEPAEAAHRLAEVNHGVDFCCAIGKDNLVATQFHPEKSGKLGLALLSRFANWSPE